MESANRGSPLPLRPVDRTCSKAPVSKRAVNAQVRALDDAAVDIVQSARPTMAAMAEPLIMSVRGQSPDLHAESWIAPNAAVIGQVRLAARVSVWYSATLRAEA